MSDIIVLDERGPSSAGNFFGRVVSCQFCNLDLLTAELINSQIFYVHMMNCMNYIQLH